MSPRSGRLKLFDNSAVRFTDWRRFGLASPSTEALGYYQSSASPTQKPTFVQSPYHHSRPGPTQETGRCNVKDVPSPGADCTVTLPPSARRSRSTRHSPSPVPLVVVDRKSTRLNSSHVRIS